MPSQVIKFFSYNEKLQELDITFQSGHRYIYSEVSQKTYEAMRLAFSKGEFFQRESVFCGQNSPLIY